MACSPSSTTHNHITKLPYKCSGHNISQQKNHFRNEFVRRLKLIRNKQVDRFRQLCEQKLDGDYKSVFDLRNSLVLNQEASELMSCDELLNILTQVENEILQEQAERYMLESEQETQAILENLMNTCKLCDALIVTSDVCDTCTRLCFE